MKTWARRIVRPSASAALAVCFLMGVPSLAPARDLKEAFPNIQWQEGPTSAALGDIAEIQVPKHFLFAGAADTRRIMEAMRNPPTDTELGFLGPASGQWFVVFEFDDVGYVRDDEKNALNADALLESIKRGTEAANQERMKRGWPTLTIVGWEAPPAYNTETNNLEWAVRGQSSIRPLVNHNTRILGRRGVMKATLVADASILGATLPEYQALIGGYSFKEGQRYAEWVKGDKVAQYGLAALVVGGAAAVAVKSGIFKWLWKVILMVGVAVAAFLKSLFAGRRTA